MLLSWQGELKDLRNVSLKSDITTFWRHKSIAPPLTVAGAGEVHSKEDLPASSLQRRKDYLDLTFEVSFFFAAYLSHARRWQYTQIRQVLALCNITSGNFTNFTKINSFFWICFGASVGKVLQALPNPLIFYFLTCSQGTFHCTTNNQSIYNLSKEEKFEELCIVNCGLDYI